MMVSNLLGLFIFVYHDYKTNSCFSATTTQLSLKIQENAGKSTITKQLLDSGMIQEVYIKQWFIFRPYLENAKFNEDFNL